MEAPEELFTKQMRKATKQVHSVSDALINAKLGFAMQSDAVWAEGLLVFYEVFKYLEQAMERDDTLRLYDVEGIRRTQLFEQDLAYYLGADWQKSYAVRPSVQAYLAHLATLEKQDPIALVAFVYHMYMGLLSGGQILRRKRALMNNLRFSRKESYEGLAVTEVTGGNVYALKKQIVDTTNTLAATLDEETRGRLLAESGRVFELNNTIVHSIEGSGGVVWRVGAIVALVIAVMVYFLLLR